MAKANTDIPQRLHLDRRAHAIAERIAHLPDDTTLTTVQVADWLGVSAEWLQIGRHKGYGPPFAKLGPNLIRYRVSEIRRWLDERIHRRTLEYTAGTGFDDERKEKMRAGWRKRRTAEGAAP